MLTAGTEGAEAHWGGEEGRRAGVLRVGWKALRRPDPETETLKMSRSQPDA